MPIRSQSFTTVQAALTKLERPPELAVTYVGGLVFRSFDGATEMIDEME